MLSAVRGRRIHHGNMRQLVVGRLSLPFIKALVYKRAAQNIQWKNPKFSVKVNLVNDMVTVNYDKGGRYSKNLERVCRDLNYNRWDAVRERYFEDYYRNQ